MFHFRKIKKFRRSLSSGWRNRGVFFAVLAWVVFFAGVVRAETGHTCYFPGTEYELNVYHIFGEEAGPTLLIIGGIHNEPGGYITADQYVDIALKRGNLIVVPRANFQTITENVRGVLGDMNRLFSLEELRFENDHAMEIVKVLKELIAESDLMVNLHDGYGYYRDKPVDDLHNPSRLGQSIIADTDVYRIPGSNDVIRLADIATRACAAVNAEVTNEEHLFRFNNHNTLSADTHFPDMRKTATYYALTRYNIPAFGIETSKNITDIPLKVRYQTLIVNAIMDEFGIVRDVVKNSLPPPRLKFLAISVNGTLPRVYPNGETVRLRPGDTVTISHIESNYERGLNVDILGYGKPNDFGIPVVIYNNTSIVVKKDGSLCGEIAVDVSAGSDDSDGEPVQPRAENFIVEVNGYRQDVPAGGILRVMKGDTLLLIGTTPPLDVFPGARLNFFGYYPTTGRINSGDDRNVSIDTGKDLFPKYSAYRRGTEYKVLLERDNESLAEMRVHLVNPSLEHLVLQFDNGNKGLVENGTTYQLSGERTFEIVEVHTTVPNNDHVRVNVRGFVGSPDGLDINVPVDVSTELLPEYSLDRRGRRFAITVSYRDRLIGQVFVRLNQNLGDR